MGTHERWYAKRQINPGFWYANIWLKPNMGISGKLRWEVRHLLLFVCVCGYAHTYLCIYVCVCVCVCVYARARWNRFGYIQMKTFSFLPVTSFSKIMSKSYSISVNTQLPFSYPSPEISTRQQLKITVSYSSHVHNIYMCVCACVSVFDCRVYVRWCQNVQMKRRPIYRSHVLFTFYSAKNSPSRLIVNRRTCQCDMRWKIY